MGNSSDCCTKREGQLLSELDTHEGRPSVFIVPGMCSNALEVKTSASDTYQVVYLNVPKIVENGPEIFKELKLQVVDATLKDGRVVKTVEEVNSSKGVSSRPFAGLAGCAHLDPEMEVPLAPLWMPIIQLLHKSFNLSCLNYDWRKWGTLKVAEEVLDNFRTGIEKLVVDGGSPVSIVAHSMGAQVTVWCLTQLGESWQTQNVKQIIFCAPAISGTPVLYPCFANGPMGNCVAGDMIHVPAELIDEDLTTLTSTFPCMIAEIPTNTGGENIWGDMVFATTPQKKYTTANVQAFLDDVATSGAQKSQWQIGKNIWPGFQTIASSIRPPSVRTDIIYSKSENTLAQVEYATEDLTTAPKFSKFEGGDSTIMGSSIEKLAEAWKGQGVPITLHATPANAHITHSGCISANFVMGLLPELLARQD